MCEICSKLTIKKPERRHYSVFTVNFEQISNNLLVFPLLTLKNQPIVELVTVDKNCTEIKLINKYQWVRSSVRACVTIKNNHFENIYF